MTTKQNAIELARTARSEAANTAKRTISAIINNWNECVKQAGFTGVFDFPTTGYTRKAQLIAELERCAAQLDDYVEPRAELATMTVEQQIRAFNAALTRVLDVEEAHAEALDLNDGIDDGKTMDMYHKWNTAPTAQIRRDMLAAAHSQALVHDRLWLIRNAKTKAERLAAHSGFTVTQCSAELDAEEGDYYASLSNLRQIVEQAHEEALEINNAYNTLYVYAPGNAAQDVWPHLTEVERAVSVEFAHQQALHDNRQHDDAIEYFAAYGSRLCLEAFTQHELKQIADFCHSDALELNSAYRECA